MRESESEDVRMSECVSESERGRKRVLLVTSDESGRMACARCGVKARRSELLPAKWGGGGMYSLCSGRKESAEKIFIANFVNECFKVKRFC